ncbi:duf1115 domain protein [Phlyctema vagabunda]|uniref:Duf1115 domain protein n=1 Tax=Phlyctema vagabunda TaxID=108571 RepID=A0ABR4P8E7_9HELO
MAGETTFPLPRHLLEAQLSMLNLILAMFSSPGEIDISPSTSESLDQLREALEATDETPTRMPADLSFTIALPIGDVHTLQVMVHVPLQDFEADPSEAPALRYSLRQSSWMSRAEVVELSSSMPKDDILAAVEYLQDAAPAFVRLASSLDQAITGTQAEPLLVRVWFYFPSLSTREKRKDLVNYAADYQLTGFVLAGKPGVLCLEGTSKNIDAYMNNIKMHSWGDIPSHQKKVSERYREDGGDAPIERAFVGMIEITDTLGEKKGKRINRGDMGALESWLTEKGLGEAFERVILSS